MRPLSYVSGVLGVVVSLVVSGALECQPPTPTAATRGGVTYQRMCAVCHGARGEGYAADEAPAIGGATFLAQVTDAQLRTAITVGRSGTTMSAWGVSHGGPLKPTDVDAVIAYLRTFQRTPPAVLDERPRRGIGTRGEALFRTACASCHGERGVGGPYVHVGGADFLSSASDGYLRAAILGGRPGTAMPAFGGRIDEGAVEDLVTALRLWQLPPTAFNPSSAFTRPPPLPLGPVPLHPKGPEPVGFKLFSAATPGEVVHAQLAKGARFGLLDARAPSDYTREHIAGAVSVPFYDPDPYVDQLPRDAWLVAYCSCPHAESGQLAQALVAKGFRKVTVLDEGLGYWRNHGWPVAAGTAP